MGLSGLQLITGGIHTRAHAALRPRYLCSGLTNIQLAERALMSLLHAFQHASVA